MGISNSAPGMPFNWDDDETNIREKTLYLKERGHKCIILLESLPPKLSWCGKDKCVCEKQT